MHTHWSKAMINESKDHDTMMYHVMQNKANHQKLEKLLTLLSVSCEMSNKHLE